MIHTKRFLIQQFIILDSGTKGILFGMIKTAHRVQHGHAHATGVSSNFLDTGFCLTSNFHTFL